jgi:cytochrome c oxidase subunit III
MTEQAHYPPQDAAVHDEPDHIGARMGMWLFLFSELMLFGALFIIYSVYRAMNVEEFHAAGHELNLAMGSFNTFVLLTSSFTMALSIAALQKRDRELSICFLLSTICLAVLFMFNKFFEWREDYLRGIFPGLESYAKLPHGRSLFYDLYFVMTGLHGLHVIAGAGVLTWALIRLVRGQITPERYTLLDNAGLYWHLVDVIWIFLLPLFYVIT